MSKVSLNEILEQIMIGVKQTDPASMKLKKKEKQIRDILSEEGAVFERKILDLPEKNLFRQGSFAIDTAIKHPAYDVDADIGVIVDVDEEYLQLRNKIFGKLDKALKQSSAVVKMKKPCLNVYYKDTDNIDVAVYSRIGEKLYHHNSIHGLEKTDRATPLELVLWLQDQLAKAPHKRKVIRLLKHFNNVVFEKLNCSENNKIPSIAITLFIVQLDFDAEKLDEMLFKVTSEFLNYVNINRKDGPSKSEYHVTNTFYKITDINEVLLVLGHIVETFKQEHYSELTNDKVVKRIMESKKVPVDNSMVGTLG